MCYTLDKVYGMEENSFDESLFTTRRYTAPTMIPQRKKSRRSLFVIIILVAIILFGVYRLVSSVGQTPQQITPTITPTPTLAFPTDTPAPTPDVSPTSSQPNPVDKTSGIDRSSVSVMVQNGSGTVGAASKMSEVLKGLGYHVTGIGNADNFNYENTTIMVKPSGLKYATLLKSDLTNFYTVASTSATLSASSSADAIVIVGK